MQKQLCVLTSSLLLGCGVGSFSAICTDSKILQQLLILQEEEALYVEKHRPLLWFPGLLPTNAAKAGLSISMPSPLAQIYSSSDSRGATAPLPLSQTSISWKITPGMSKFRNSSFKDIQEKKQQPPQNFAVGGLGK